MRTLFTIALLLITSAANAQSYPAWLDNGPGVADEIQGTPDDFTIEVLLSGGTVHSQTRALPPELLDGATWGELSASVRVLPISLTLADNSTQAVEFGYEVRETAIQYFGDGLGSSFSRVLFNNVVDSGTVTAGISLTAEIVDPATSPISRIRNNPHPIANPWVEVTREAYAIDGFSVDLPQGFGAVEIDHTFDARSQRFQFVTIPEPSSLGLLLIGLIGVILPKRQPSEPR